MLIIEPRAGLSNRMIVLDGARSLARAIGHPMTVVWRLDADLGASFDDLFEPLDGIEAWHQFDCRTKAGYIERDRFVGAANADVSFNPFKVGELLRYGFSFADLKDTGVIHIDTWSRIHPSEKPFADFKPTPLLRERIGAITANFNETIGVHIRRTDSRQSIANSPTIGFVVRMRQALERGEAQTFFLASDDPREEQTLAAAFPGRVIRQPKRSLDRSRAEAIEDAVVDLYCLAATTKMFGSYYSTFSGVSATIGGISRETIRLPRAASAKDREAPVLTFGIPLKTVVDPVERRFRSRMLSATLASIYAQTDGAFRVILAGSHPPDVDIPVDDRLEFLIVDAKPARSLEDARSDHGRKAWKIASHHVERGGGHLMLMDMDDFVSNRLVEFVRANPDPHGYLIERGYIMNVRSNRFVSTDIFHKKCGSSAILNLAPGDVGGPESRFSRLRSDGHYRVAENAIAEGRPLMPVPFEGAVWVLNHGGNLTWLFLAVDHNQPDGPQELLTTIERTGLPTSQLAAEFAVPERYPLLDEYFAKARRSAPPRLSVAIVTYRRPVGLRRLLAALTPQVAGNPAREIVVVNDGSHDDAYEAVRAEFAETIKYRALPNNVGVAKARNASADLATGDYLVFTDDDCEPPHWWLDWLDARLQWASDLDVVAGPTRPLPPQRWTFFSRVEASHRMLPKPSRSQGGTLFVTANVAIRRSLFWKLGGFGFPGSFHGAGEDTELASRLSRAGASVTIDPGWYVRHEVGLGFAAACRRYWRYGYANGAMLRLTTAPQIHDGLVWYRRRHHLRNWIAEYREQRQYAVQVSRHRAVQIVATLVASLVRIAYYDGCAAALRDRDRRRVTFST